MQQEVERYIDCELWSRWLRIKFKAQPNPTAPVMGFGALVLAEKSRKQVTKSSNKRGSERPETETGASMEEQPKNGGNKYSIIVPTYNERLNIPLIVFLIFKHLRYSLLIPDFFNRISIDPVRIRIFGNFKSYWFWISLFNWGI